MSFSIAHLGILNSGIVFVTVPPGLSDLSNIVTSKPSRARKYADDKPAGPAPIIGWHELMSMRKMILQRSFSKVQVDYPPTKTTGYSLTRIQKRF